MFGDDIFDVTLYFDNPSSDRFTEWLDMVQFVSTLPPTDQCVLRLFHLGLKQDEIASDMGVSQSAICQRLKRLYRDYKCWREK